MPIGMIHRYSISNIQFIVYLSHARTIGLILVNNSNRYFMVYKFLNLFIDLCYPRTDYCICVDISGVYLVIILYTDPNSLGLASNTRFYMK